MTHPVVTHERRCSQRIPQSLPLFVRCLDFPRRFVGHVKTVEVSGHGCVIQALSPFPRGTELRLEIRQPNRMTTARVVRSVPIGTGMDVTTWAVALELDTPGNVWMVKSPPRDWPKTSEQQRSRQNLPQIQNWDTGHETRL